MAPFRLSPTERQRLIRCANEAYPSEACGVILQWPSGERRLLAGENVQDALHAANPTLPDQRTAYTLDPKTLRTVHEIRRAGGRLLAVWHSHPNGLADFSRADQRQALNRLGVPHYPDAVQIVVAIGGPLSLPQIVAAVWDPLLRRYRRQDGVETDAPSDSGENLTSPEASR